MLRLRDVATVLTCAFFLTGCLGSTYAIPKDELARLAALPPEARGQAVRVIQNFRSDDPDDPGVVARVDATMPFMVAASFSRHTTRPGDGRRPPPRYGVQEDDGDDGNSSNSGSSSRAVFLLTLYALASVGVGLVLAGTEGARYDGHLSVNPNYPILLYDDEGGQVVVPLVDLTPELVDWAEGADIMPDYDPQLRFLGRAPLNRIGFAYGLDLGVADFVPTSAFSPGFRMQTSFGGYPLQCLGIHALLGFGAAENAAFADLRYGVEARFWPLAVSRLHLGLYAAGGGSTTVAGLATTQPRATHAFVAGGGLVEIDITTRLAFTIRAGVSTFVRENTWGPSFEGTAGLTVY